MTVLKKNVVDTIIVDKVENKLTASDSQKNIVIV